MYIFILYTYYQHSFNKEKINVTRLTDKCQPQCHDKFFWRLKVELYMRVQLVAAGI